MVEIVYYVASSLDGYIATPDGGIDWLPPLDADSEDFGYAEFYATIDGLIMGRHTYEKVLELGEWMYPNKPCWVCSHQPLVVERSEVNLTDKSPGEIAAELEAQQLKRVWLVGGGQLASSFRTKELISEYIVAVMPMILGAGLPLFTPFPSQEQLRLVDCKVYPQGVVLLQYVNDRALE